MSTTVEERVTEHKEDQVVDGLTSTLHYDTGSHYLAQYTLH